MSSMFSGHSRLFSLCLVAVACSPCNACSVMEMNRVGRYIVEESIRTTSYPTLLVALLGEYDQKEEDHWDTRDPISVQNITIDLTFGEVFLGLPPAELGVTINEPMQSTQPTKIYTVEVNDDGSSNTAVLNGPDLTEPFTFDYVPPPSDSFSRLEDVFIYSDNLERGYFFHNSPASSPELQPNGQPVPSVSSGGGGPSNTQPLVTILDLSNPNNPDDVSYTTFHYTGHPSYFNGPPRNHWDRIQVVELPENGADCFQSAYFYYNETAIRLVGYRQYTRNSFNLNAIAFEQDVAVQERSGGGNAAATAYAYNVENIGNAGAGNENNGRTETPVEYKIYKINVATGAKTEIPLKNVQDPMPFPPTMETTTTTGDVAGAAGAAGAAAAAAAVPTGASPVASGSPTTCWTNHGPRTTVWIGFCLFLFSFF